MDAFVKVDKENIPDDWLDKIVCKFHQHGNVVNPKKKRGVKRISIYDLAEGLSPTSRVKKFVFLFTAVCAKWTRTARSWWQNLYTSIPYDKLLLDKSIFFEAFEFQSPKGKGALCPNLNVFGFLLCRYAYAQQVVLFFLMVFINK